jgi:hypothetical protein
MLPWRNLSAAVVFICREQALRNSRSALATVD